MIGGIHQSLVIASEAKQSSALPRRQSGLLRRVAPRNDDSTERRERATSVQMDIRGLDDFGPLRHVGPKHLRKLLRRGDQRLRALCRQEALHRIGIENIVYIRV